MKLTAGFITFLTLSQTVAHASNLELQDAKDSALHTGSMLVAIAGTQVLQEMAHVADNRKDNTHKKNG